MLKGLDNVPLSHGIKVGQKVVQNIDLRQEFFDRVFFCQAHKTSKLELERKKNWYVSSNWYGVAINSLYQVPLE
jgi:hypothetical protein